MSIVTFWGSGKEQVGKTLAVVAIATNMAIEYNKRILVVSASYNNDTLKNCYWGEAVSKKGNMFTAQTGGVELDNGIEGLAKMIQSNKISANAITDYTKVVFKDRLEILLGFEEKTSANHETVGRIYSEIVRIAAQYYDMVFVDLDNEINIVGTEEILKNSDVVIAMASQKIASIKVMQQKRKSIPSQTMLLIGKYDAKSKYTIKNITRMIGERKEVLTMPYNTLYFEAAQEGTVPDLFLKLRRIEDKNDENSFFIEEVKRVTEEITKRMN